MSTPVLCANMIVRNESAIIERSIRAMAPYVGAYVICDTGSTDDTVAIIERTFAEFGVPGEIVHAPFENFEQARNAALDAARASTLEFDYLLFCDADMELQVRDQNFAAGLSEPVYMLMQHSVTGGLAYQNARLMRRDNLGRYVGVTHEFLDAGPRPYPLCEGAFYLDHAAGSSRAEKFDRDIALLIEGLRADPDNARYVFYLAQSYRDNGQLAKAFKTYERRIALGGWEEEVWYSQYQLALLSERLENEDAFTIDLYLKAFEARPQRAEPLTQLARYLREHGRRFALGLVYAQRAKDIPMPADVLFLDESAYQWRALDEYAIAAYWNGLYRESMVACRDLLGSGNLPEEQRKRVIENLDFSLTKLGLRGAPSA